MKTAVIYARVSSSNDRQDTSRQIEDLKKNAISQDIEIVNIFQEHISGAKKIEERQILGECLEYCKRESVNILLLSELSRLGRSTLQVLRSLDILHESKVSVYIQNLGLYTLQPNGEVNPIASIICISVTDKSLNSPSLSTDASIFKISLNKSTNKVFNTSLASFCIICFTLPK